MALRVLLADESSTIKRVMQLALQDFGVEVKSVPVGLDVLAVTKTFRPDIIFADVLLAKRNGYDVCLELKSDSETRNTPVVLMWSGFMEVDEARISQAGPDGRLEKPFDSETLRNLVQQMVPKTQSNPVSSFLQFPKMPEFSEERAQNTQNNRQQAPSSQNQPSTAEPSFRSDTPSRPNPANGQGGAQNPQQPVRTEKPSLGKIPVSAPMNFESMSNEADQDDVFKIQNDNTFSGMTRSHEIPMIDSADMDPENDNELLVAMDEDFATVPLQAAQTRDQLEEDGWTQQDLKKFKIQTPEPTSDDDFASRFVIPQDDLANAHVEIEGEFEEISFGDDLSPVQAKAAAPQPPRSHEIPMAQQAPQAPRATVTPASLSRNPTQSQTPSQSQSHVHSQADAVRSESVRTHAVQTDSARDPALIERVIREEAREVIENICWKVIPEMVERIVREEINKILRETEKSL